LSDLTRLYRDSIRRHADQPVGYGRAIEATHQFESDNPQCGDRILMQLRVREGHVEEAAFEGEACAICMASASLLCENVPGNPVSELEDLHNRLHAALTGDVEEKVPAELNALLGVKPYPSRIRCATLPWEAACLALK
jgi:nitrogen fixation NifU-like protein